MRQLLSLDVQIQNAIVNSLPIIPSFPTEFLLAWGTAFWLPLSTLLKLCLLTTEALLWWWVLIVLHENQLLPKRSEWLFNLHGLSVGLVLGNIWIDKSFRSANHLFINTKSSLNVSKCWKEFATTGGNGLPLTWPDRCIPSGSAHALAEHGD